MEIKNHQNGLISIKDNGDVNISHSKWDFIFLDPVLNDCKVYFIGWRLDFIYKNEINNNLESLIENLSFEVFIDKDNHMKLFLKTRELDRNILSVLWQFYEYPSLIFLKKDSDEVKLIKEFETKTTKMKLPSGFCHLYKMDPESDVIWIDRSNDFIFSEI